MRRGRVGAAAIMAATVAVAMLLPAAAGAARRHASPVKVGIICSCTGPQASTFQTAVPVAQAWASLVDAHGGLAGHPVQIVKKDDETNPGTSLAAAETLVERDHVVAVIDDTNLDAGWTTLVEQHHVPVVGINFPSPAMGKSPYYFPTGVTEGYLDDEIVLGAKKAGAKSIAAFYCAEQAVCAQEVDALKTVGSTLHVPVVYSAGISSSAPSYTAQCLAAKQAGADALFVADAPSVNISVVGSCLQQGYHPIPLSDDGAVALSFRQSAGMQGLIAAEGDLPFFVKSTPAAKQMVKALRKYQPATLKSKNYNEIANQTWVGGLLLQKAASRGAQGAPVTAATVANGLYGMVHETARGMAPPLTFARGEAHTVDCWFWMRVQHHRFTTPYGLKPVCAPKG